MLRRYGATASRSHTQRPQAPRPVLLLYVIKFLICNCNAIPATISYSIIVTQGACIDPRNALLWLTLRGRQRFNPRVSL